MRTKLYYNIFFFLILDYRYLPGNVPAPPNIWLGKNPKDDIIYKKTANPTRTLITVLILESIGTNALSK